MTPVFSDNSHATTQERIQERIAELGARLDTHFVAGLGGVPEYHGQYVESATSFVFSADVVGAAIRIAQNGEDFIDMPTGTVPAEPARAFTTFVFRMDQGNGSPWPEPHGRFDLHLNEGKIVSFSNAKTSRFWRGKDGSVLYYHAQLRRIAPPHEALHLDATLAPDSYFVSGLCLLHVPTRMLTPGGPARIRIVPFNRSSSPNWIRICSNFALKPGFPAPALTIGGIEAAEALLAGPQRPSKHGFQFLFGDLHNHSGHPGGIVCGAGERQELFEYARDVSGLDFFCLSDHDFQMNPESWAHLEAMNERFDEPGRFVAIPGFEWTGGPFAHRNVYYRRAGGPFFSANVFGARLHKDVPQLRDPADVWRFLDERGVEAITVPHHFSTNAFPLSLDHRFSEKYDRLAEIFSCWGNSLEHGCVGSHNALRVAELAGVNYLRWGAPRFGFIASSDGHDGCPGNSQGPRGPVWGILGSGRAAVLARELSREGVFEALHSRRCYATTGAHIVLWVTVAGYPMGAFVPAEAVDPPLVVSADLACPWPIERIDVYRNGERVHTERPDGATATFSWEDRAYRADEAANYFVKVTQTDGEMAWSSPVWIG